MSNNIVPSVEVIEPDYKRAYYELALLVSVAYQSFFLWGKSEGFEYMKKAIDLIDRVSSAPSIQINDNDNDFQPRDHLHSDS